MSLSDLGDTVKFNGPKKKKNERMLRDLRIRISDAIDENKNAIYVDLKDTNNAVNDRLIDEGYKLLLVTDDEQVILTWD